MSRHTVYDRVREGMLLLAGLAGIAFETAVARAPRAELLVVFAGMIGLNPARLLDGAIRDRRGRSKGGE